MVSRESKVVLCELKLQAIAIGLFCSFDGRMAESDVDGQNGMISAEKGNPMFLATAYLCDLFSSF